MPVEARIELLPGDAAIFTLSGAMTMGQSLKAVDGQLQNALASGIRHMVLDLNGVEYADSAGLGLLVHTFGLLNERRGTLRLCSIQPRLRTMLHTTRTDTILTLDGNREDSLAALKK
ncbi:MAG TPA: STAS domain-containing protein [Acidobacteriaceae bacterium]|nr:STAS domain-containing protein [Acidobacteriaceae bacterium]